MLVFHIFDEEIHRSSQNISNLLAIEINVFNFHDPFFEEKLFDSVSVSIVRINKI